MPDNINRRQTDFSLFDKMSTEELENILRLDAQNSKGDESDTDLILYIMGVLADRDHNEDEKSTEEAFRSFQKNCYPLGASEKDLKKGSGEKSHPSKAKWLRSSLTAAAMVALVLLTTVSVKGNRFDLWGKLANWTQDIFHFGENYDKNDGEPAERCEVEFSSLREALENKNIPGNLVPTWLPSGYEFYESQVYESPESTTIIAAYQNHVTGEEITIQIKDYLNKHVQQIEKGKDFFDVYQIDGTDYHIFNNQIQYHAVWITDSCECYISGDMALEELYKMLDSIKGGN